MNQVTKHVVTIRKTLALDAKEPEMYALATPVRIGRIKKQ
jgi:hypothetical protein